MATPPAMPSSSIAKMAWSHRVHCSTSGEMSTAAAVANAAEQPKQQLIIPLIFCFFLRHYRRYKSLSSLQLTPESNTPISTVPHGHEKPHQLSKSASTHCAREGTLDSSRSGGRTSGDSKLPEKKTRRLSRPRSLSNLVWELRPQKKESTKKKLYVHHFDHRPQATLYL